MSVPNVELTAVAEFNAGASEPLPWVAPWLRPNADTDFDAEAGGRPLRPRCHPLWAAPSPHDAMHLAVQSSRNAVERGVFNILEHS